MQTTRSIVLLCALLALCGLCSARPHAPMAVAAATPSPKAMSVPCYMKIFGGFCFVEKEAGACTFYANPSYASFKQCAEDQNMGKTLKCADVPGDLKDKYATSYKTCADKEVLQGSSNSGSNSGSSAAANWAQMDSMDVAGKDIASGGKAFTEVCGGLDQVKQQCVKTNGCVGFTWNGSCGYLKTSVGETKSRQSWTVFAIKK